MAMTEEQKKANAERLRKAREAKKAAAMAAEAENTATEEKATEKEQTNEKKTEEAKFSASEVEAMIAAAVAKAMAESQKPTIVQLSPDTERVHFLWQAPVSDENVFEIAGGLYGRVVGKTGTFSVPKAEISRAMDSIFRYMLEKRWIIVLSGLTDEEKRAYDVDYKPGEILDKGAFSHIVELGDELIRIYPELCGGHREIVQKVCYEAYRSGNKEITRERVTALKDAAASIGEHETAFQKIIEAMNEADAK